MDTTNQTCKISHVSVYDVEMMRRVAHNLRDYAEGRMPVNQAAGVFSVNAEELLEVIERITRPEPPLTDADRAILA